MSEAPPEPTLDDGTLLGRARRLTSFIRDVGVILGIPVILTIGVKLYDLQTKALEAEIKSNEAQIKAVEAQNSLKEIQYDRALTLLKSQKKVFSMERASLEKEIVHLKASGDDIGQATRKLSDAQMGLNVSEALIRAWEACSGAAIQKINAKQLQSCNDILVDGVRSALNK
jgi:predicted  nucleic acid-binding Zn-ribbon protein